jgi:hypothetical protein
MARIETRREVTTPVPAAAARDQLLRVFQARGATMAIVADDRLEGRTGSQVALRLKGGWIAKPEEFPVVAAVLLLPGATGTVVRITVADDLGFGLKAGVTKKYTQAVEGLADALAGGVGSAPPAGCPHGHAVAPGNRFCPSCGTPLAVFTHTGTTP